MVLSFWPADLRYLARDLLRVFDHPEEQNELLQRSYCFDRERHFGNRAGQVARDNGHESSNHFNKWH
jgi:hypothetical protein